MPSQAGRGYVLVHVDPLVVGLRTGDPRAFERAFSTFGPRVHAFLLRLSRRRDVADDLLQDTFVKLAKHAPRLREDTNLAAWLFTVARNEYRSHRRLAFLDLGRLFAFGLELEIAAPKASEDPEVRDQVRALERALGKLSFTHREVLLLVGVEGLDQEVAAEVLGVGYDALRQRLARARAALSAALEADGARAADEGRATPGAARAPKREASS